MKLLSWIFYSKQFKELSESENTSSNYFILLFLFEEIFELFQSSPKLESENLTQELENFFKTSLDPIEIGFFS